MMSDVLYELDFLFLKIPLRISAFWYWSHPFKISYFRFTQPEHWAIGRESVTGFSDIYLNADCM